MNLPPLLLSHRDGHRSRTQQQRWRREAQRRQRWVWTGVGLLVAGACAFGASAARAASPEAVRPTIQMAPQGVEFMSGGGASAADAAFMRSVAPQWGATFEFTASHTARGTFPPGVQVRVRNQFNGDEVLDATASGPFLLARLEPGTYVVEARLGELTLSQTMTVALGVPGRVLFVWPSNVDLAAATRPRQTLSAANAAMGADAPR